MFEEDGVAALANYSLVTIEKWYTPCGSQMPSQSGPDCAVEDKCVGVFSRARQRSAAP